MRIRFLLLTLSVALGTVACTGDSGQDRAMGQQSKAPAPAANQPDLAAVPPQPNVPPQPSSTPESEEPAPLPTQPPAATAAPAASLLPVIGPAPSWNNDVWLNSETPLPLEDLRGKVVLLEFWTFG